MKALVFAGLALGAILALSACNTVQGVGRDIRSMGSGIERAGSR